MEDPGYTKFLEQELEYLEKVLGQLMLAYWEHKPIDPFIAEIEEWMCDWWVSLSEEDQKRLDVIKGWTYE